MSIIEVTAKDRVTALLRDDPRLHLEAIDENILGVEGIVSVFTTEGPQPPNRIIVRWAQGSLGLANIAHVAATTLSGLGDVTAALPDNGEYDVHVPFWAAPALQNAPLSSEITGAIALYSVKRDQLVLPPSHRQCARVDRDVVKPMFRKLADDSPAYALGLRDQIASVAVVTHLRDGLARLGVYTVAEHRRRGFGRAVLASLSEELLALSIEPTVFVELGDEAAVRMVEGAGFRQTHAFLKARLSKRRSDGLIQLR